MTVFPYGTQLPQGARPPGFGAGTAPGAQPLQFPPNMAGAPAWPAAAITPVVSPDQPSELMPDRQAEAAFLRREANRYQEFWYSTGSFTLATTASLPNVPVNTNSDSIFVCTSIAVRTTAGGANPMNTEISWRRGGSGALIMDRAIPAELWMNVIQIGNMGAGSGWSLPTWRYLSRPVVFNNNDTVQFSLLDLGTGVLQTMTIVLGGWKFYLGDRPGVTR